MERGAERDRLVARWRAERTIDDRRCPRPPARWTARFCAVPDVPFRWKAGGRDAMSARTQQWKGRIKQAAGSLTGNRRLEEEGKADRQAGEAKEELARAKEKLIDVIDKAASSIEDALDPPKRRRR
jgi:uncharacterized protein YjbJ (UPF0337 family)